MLERARASGTTFYREPFVRFEGRREEHLTFFLKDPSNNLLEFKYYLDSKMMY
jgi:extradiol dioxygenase family protein